MPVPHYPRYHQTPPRTAPTASPREGGGVVDGHSPSLRLVRSSALRRNHDLQRLSPGGTSTNGGGEPSSTYIQSPRKPRLGGSAGAARSGASTPASTISVNSAQLSHYSRYRNVKHDYLKHTHQNNSSTSAAAASQEDHPPNKPSHTNAPHHSSSMAARNATPDSDTGVALEYPAPWDVSNPNGHHNALLSNYNFNNRSDHERNTGRALSSRPGTGATATTMGSFRIPTRPTTTATVTPPRTAPHTKRSVHVADVTECSASAFPTLSSASERRTTTISSSQLPLEEDLSFVNVYTSKRRRAATAGDPSTRLPANPFEVSNYTRRANRDATMLVAASIQPLISETNDKVLHGSNTDKNISSRKRVSQKKQQRSKLKEKQASSQKQTVEDGDCGIFSLTQPAGNNNKPATHNQVDREDDSYEDETSVENNDGVAATEISTVPDTARTPQAKIMQKARSDRQKRWKCRATNLPQPEKKIDALMQERHSDLLLGGGRIFLSLRNVQDRVDEKMKILRNDPEARDEVILSARRAQSAKIHTFRSKNWLLSAVDNAVGEAEKKYKANHLNDFEPVQEKSATSPQLSLSHMQSLTYSSHHLQSEETTPHSIGGGVDSSSAHQQPPPITASLVLEDTAPRRPKVPAYIIHTATHKARTMAVLRAQEAHLRDGSTWHAKNTQRQDANRKRLVGVAEDRVHSIMESVTRHDRIVDSANAQRERLQHSDLKAQWCTDITIANFQRMLNDRALQVLTCKNIHFHDQLFRTWYHAWHDPTAKRVAAEKKRLSRARLFLSIILARMWGCIIVKRRRVLLIKQAIQDTKESNSLAVAVHVFHARLKKVQSTVRRFLQMRGYGLGLIILQWERSEQAYRESAHDEAAERLQIRLQEEEIASRSRAARAEKKAQLEALAKMTPDQRHQHRADEIVKNDVPNYLSGDELPIALKLERLIGAWHDQRTYFLKKTQGEIWKAEQMAYNKQILARSALPSAKMAKTPVPKPPTLRPPPRLLPSNVVDALVKDAFSDYFAQMTPIRKKAAIKVVKRGMECDYPATKQVMKVKHFGEHRHVVRERYLKSVGPGLCVGGVIEEDTVSGFVLAMMNLGAGSVQIQDVPSKPILRKSRTGSPIEVSRPGSSRAQSRGSRVPSRGSRPPSRTPRSSPPPRGRIGGSMK